METVKVGDFISTGFNGDSYPYVVFEIGNHRGRKVLRAYRIPMMLNMGEANEVRFYNAPGQFSEDRILEALLPSEEIIALLEARENISFVEVVSPHHRSKDGRWKELHGYSWGYWKGFCYSQNPHF